MKLAKGKRREEEDRRSRGMTPSQRETCGVRRVPAREKEGEFNVPLQWVTRGCNCRSGRNGASIALMGVVH